MRPNKETDKLRRIFTDIVNGFSATTHDKHGLIYIKHLNNADTAEIEAQNRCCFEDAVRKGLPTYEERDKEIKRQGAWSDEKDVRIRDLGRYLDNLETTKTQVFQSAEKANIQHHIDEKSNELAKLETEKAILIDLTAESYAKKKVNEFYIFTSLHRDASLKDKLFTPEEFDEVPGKELSELIAYYNSEIMMFDSESLKKVALSTYFSSFFTLCKDDPYSFYGVPIVQLTFYQVELFGYGLYFKNIMSDMKNKPVKEVMEDPEKLLDWINSTKNIESSVEKTKKFGHEGANVSVFGADKQQSEGVLSEDGEQTVNLHEEAKKRGGRLSMIDMMKLENLV